ncbi:MAG: CoB--CoM heterodisulfide reductase iron-sulfur subunit A family protein, partial [Thermoflexia bacterium]
SLDIANAGYEVVLVERLPSIGGRMAQLSETFPTLDCSQCILTPRTVEVGRHSNIQLLTYSEVESVAGEVGCFQVRIRRHAAYVDWEKCTGCGLCQEKCPSKVPAEFQRGLGTRKAIYTLSPQAVPNKPVIDREACIYFQKGRCRACEKFCPTGAIAYEQTDAFVETEVGAIILATGYDLYGLENLPEYGGGKIPDVIDALAFERLLSASGPTAGKVMRPSDGREPREVVFIQCAGSREPARHLSHCSKICCMYSAKQAILYRHRVHDGQAYVFYIDIRSPGKGYDEFIQRAMEKENVVYLRGKVSRVFTENGQVVVLGADTLSGQQVRIVADLVVVAPAMVP